MKRVSILAMLILILAAGVLPAAAITGGELDGEGHPNVGLMIADIDGEPQWRCSGTLIAPRVFLTAGHCVGDGATGARVWFDTDLTDNEEYPYGGETSIEGMPVPHPDYNWGDSDPHDVGLVILEEEVTDIEPATLPTPDLLTQLKKDRTLEGGYEDGVYFRSVGYGRTLESWPPPVLVSEKIRRVSESEYVSLTKVHLHLSQKAVFDESGSCFGDSGGPVFWVDPDGNEVIVAVTSTGDAQCVATGLNYRVDTQGTLEWILDWITR
ncbi:MAG TPA: trypsin-like serine protease [Anaerolineae bacterium]|nr:trypsin-like serine protease [Anaerolineae bacterium]